MIDSSDLPNKPALMMVLKVIALSGASATLAVYLFFCPALNEQFIAGILFYPVKTAGHCVALEKVAGVRGKEVFFSADSTADNPQLNGWLYRKPGANLVVIFNHGNTGNLSYRQWKAEAIIDSGASLFLYDYRGYGRSDGKPTVAGIVEDAVSAYDYLVKEQGFASSSIVLYGESLGTVVSSEVARRRICAGLIMQSPCISAEALCKEQMKILSVYPSPLFFRPSLDNLEYARGAHPPMLIVTGKRDEIIPFERSLTLFEQTSQPKSLLVLQNSSHNDFSSDLKQFIVGMSKFLSSLRRVS